MPRRTGFEGLPGWRRRGDSGRAACSEHGISSPSPTPRPVPLFHPAIPEYVPKSSCRNPRLWAFTPFPLGTQDTSHLAQGGWCAGGTAEFRRPRDGDCGQAVPPEPTASRSSALGQMNHFDLDFLNSVSSCGGLRNREVRLDECTLKNLDSLANATISCDDCY